MAESHAARSEGIIADLGCPCRNGAHNRALADIGRTDEHHRGKFRVWGRRTELRGHASRCQRYEPPDSSRQSGQLKTLPCSDGLGGEPRARRGQVTCSLRLGGYEAMHAIGRRRRRRVADVWSPLRCYLRHAMPEGAEHAQKKQCRAAGAEVESQGAWEPQARWDKENKRSFTGTPIIGTERSSLPMSSSRSRTHPSRSHNSSTLLMPASTSASAMARVAAFFAASVAARQTCHRYPLQAFFCRYYFSTPRHVGPPRFATSHRAAIPSARREKNTARESLRSWRKPSIVSGSEP